MWSEGVCVVRGSGARKCNCPEHVNRVVIPGDMCKLKNIHKKKHPGWDTHTHTHIHVHTHIEQHRQKGSILGHQLDIADSVSEMQSISLTIALLTSPSVLVIVIGMNGLSALILAIVIAPCNKKRLCECINTKKSTKFFLCIAE